jgi:hypothetical protein
MNNRFILIIFIIILISTQGEIYKVFVDKEFGFFGVRANSTNFTSYENRTLYININDTVIWENWVITPNERVTIVSDNMLWNESTSLLSDRYKIFNYTFNKSGTYKIHLKENQIFKYPENFNNTKDNETKTNDTLPDYFRFQVRVPTKYQTIIVGKIPVENTEVTIIKPKNKIVARSGSNYSKYNEEEEEYIDYITPQIKIEKSISPYAKYTLLELLKSIFVDSNY